MNRLRWNFLMLFPIAYAAYVWASALSFVPVPWPDDSAFYFVAHEFFKWPPRWVMLPQAPFEPTYADFNFNTMPLYPLLLGIGRWIGIDGSHLLKLWPLGFWALSGVAIVGYLKKAKLSGWAATLSIFVLMMDPTLRWASVLVRPESLIGLCGTVLVLGLTLGFPKRFEAKNYWNPVSACLAIAAYAHFNAIHLLFPVLATFLLQPKKLFRILIITTAYLIPWILTVAFHPQLFLHQMIFQFRRLAVGNPWLSTVEHALNGIFEQMGSPQPLEEHIRWASLSIWIFILIAFGLGAYEILNRIIQFKKASLEKKTTPTLSTSLSLIPAAAWVLGSFWLCETKPEVWFTYYLHLSVWLFSILFILKFWNNDWIRVSWLLLVVPTLFVFWDVTQIQAHKMKHSQSWNWDTHRAFIDCIDQKLTEIESSKGFPKPFRVWDPTFPDITIELSNRHPQWIFSRTNDFWDRVPLAIQHGKDVEVVVIPETINYEERWIEGPAENFPQIKSIWMNWKGYFLNQLDQIPGWKPKRWICQRGRWQAFFYSE